MLMEVNIAQAGQTVAWAQIDLDYDTKTWTTQENRRWGSLGFTSHGYFEMKSPDLMQLGNKVISNPNNVLLLRKPPTQDPEYVRLKGDGSLPDPFNSNYAGSAVTWCIPELSKLRVRILEICKKILKPTPETFLTPGLPPMTEITTQKTAKGKVTNCGVFPGWIAGRLGAGSLVPEQIEFDKYKDAEGETVTPDKGVVTAPMTAWDIFAAKLELRRPAQAGKIWIPYDRANPARRPQPGDFYVLAKGVDLREFGHVGVMIDSVGPTWITADCGQGQENATYKPDPDNPTKKVVDKLFWSRGMAAGYRRRTFSEADGELSGEFGARRWLKGWVNVDELFLGWKP